MKLFKHYTYSWWQIGVLKLSLLLLGVAIGAQWRDYFVDYVVIIATVGIVLALYMVYASFTQ
ncbi:MAG: hypothetical protein QG653_67 [Patescibacteria group bacterium]|nr:hypothetical protein [Patescibacteria group bacterium]